MVIALPSDRLERTDKGLIALKNTGLGYVVGYFEPEMDVENLFITWYPKQDK